MNRKDLKENKNQRVSNKENNLSVPEIPDKIICKIICVTNQAYNMIAVGVTSVVYHAGMHVSQICYTGGEFTDLGSGCIIISCTDGNRYCREMKRKKAIKFLNELNTHNSLNFVTDEKSIGYGTWYMVPIKKGCIKIC